MVALTGAHCSAHIVQCIWFLPICASWNCVFSAAGTSYWMGDEKRQTLSETTKGPLSPKTPVEPVRCVSFVWGDTSSRSDRL